jgi:hypothetical protein
MPELAQLVDGIGRDDRVACVRQAIAGAGASDARLRQAFEPAGKFIDMAFVTHQMRALIGDSQEKLQASAPCRIDDAVELLVSAGCLNGF